jgi:hypothetical protein
LVVIHTCTTKAFSEGIEHCPWQSGQVCLHPVLEIEVVVNLLDGVIVWKAIEES